MAAKRVGDVALSSRLPPLLPFLAPSVSYQVWTPIRTKLPPFLKYTHTPGNLRCLATGTSSLKTSAATAVKVKNDDSLQSTSQPQMKEADHNEVNTILQNVFSSNRKASSDQSGASSARPNPANISSADLFRASLSKVQTNRNSKDGQGEIDRLLNFGDEFGGNLSKTELLRRSFENVTKAPPLPPPIRLDAFVGRSEETDPQKGIDLGRALRNLEAKCRYNNVRSDFMKQRFHMRPGLKRKALKSERWRKRFKEGFKAVVAKVQDMRKRGW